MGASVVTLLGFRLAARPADPAHPFGHGRLEYMSAFAVAAMTLLMGAGLLQTSVVKLLHPTAPTFSWVTLLVLLASVGCKGWMFFFYRTLGRRIDSPALLASARDSRADALTTAAVLVACLLFFAFGWNLDAWLGLAVSLFILASGLKTARTTLDPLLGAPPDPALVDAIEREILQFSAFCGVHDLIVHNYGPGRCFASAHVEVPETANIVACHEQVDRCEKLVQERLDLALVLHVDPIVTDDAVRNRTEAALAALLRTLHPDLTLHDFRMTPKSDRSTNLIFDVVVPDGLALSHAQLRAQVNDLARRIDPVYSCIITFDTAYLRRQPDAGKQPKGAGKKSRKAR